MLRIVAIVTLTLFLRVTNSAYNWGPVLPAMQQFITTGSISAGGQAWNSYALLKKSNGWTILQYIYGPAAHPARYKSRIIIYHDPEERTKWHLYVPMATTADAVETTLEDALDRHQQGCSLCRRRKTSHDISTAAADANAASVLHAFITSTNNAATTTAWIKTVDKQQSIAVQHRVDDVGGYVDYAPGTATGKIAMDLIMHLLVTQFAITGDIQLMDMSARPCPTDGSRIPYGRYNAYKGVNQGYYGQWNFVMNPLFAEESQRGYDYINVLKPDASNSVGALFAGAPVDNILEEVGEDGTFADYVGTALGLGTAPQATTLQAFMTAVFDGGVGNNARDCVNMNKWSGWFCTKARIADNIAGINQGPETYDHGAGAPGFHIAAKYEEMNYVHGDNDFDEDESSEGTERSGVVTFDDLDPYYSYRGMSLYIKMDTIVLGVLFIGVLVVVCGLIWFSGVITGFVINMKLNRYAKHSQTQRDCNSKNNMNKYEENAPLVV